MVTGKAALPSGSRQQPEREKRTDARGGQKLRGAQRAAPPPRSGGWWWYPRMVLSGGWWSAAGAIAARGEMHGQDRVLFLRVCEKKAD